VAAHPMLDPVVEPTRAAPSRGSLRFIGNATVLLQVAGFTLLTDPNFTRAGERVPIGYGLSARRLVDPAMRFEELPPVDLVVLSHLHGDHFDPGVERRLDRSMPIITTPQAAIALERKGFMASVGIETWEHADRRGPHGRLRITATPGRHAPGPLHALLPQVMGTVIEAWTADRSSLHPSTRIYISGDTILYAGLREIGVRFPELDVALLHLGGTQVLGLTVTMDEEQGAELLRGIAPRLTIPIHVDDYDRFTTTLPAFQEAVSRAGLDRRIRVLERGEVHELLPAPD
jgi:L-ascorbate metabolism protein UlaG (beta-lactamase superfamily)